MKTQLHLAALGLLSTVLMQSPALGQGSLTPPGAPAPTMKTLQQVEPRTPISSAPFTISQPGSYYLTTNLTVTTATNAITIATSGVTLDLNGFELIGNAAALNGVLARPGTTNIAIVNGSATGWSQHGIDLHQTSGSRLENVRATANGGRGFSVGAGAVITHCVARHNVSDGISTGDGAVLKACHASSNGGCGLIAGDSSLVKDCVANGNGNGSTGVGILVTSRATISGCTANQNRNDGIRAASDCRIVNNHASANGAGATAAGIRTTGANNYIDQNHTSDNSGYGILSSAGVNADVVIRNVSRDNALGNFLPNTGGTFGPLSTPATATSPWANFLDTFLLTVSKNGTGTGSVSSAPSGIDCGATCSGSFVSGATVTLTATPDAGSTFAGWSGAASGTGPAIITMDSAKTVTATFTLNTYNLTVSKAGTGTGTVTSSPAGIDCGSTCTAGYAAGTTITLTATPGPGSTFLGWSGAASGTGPAIITMNSAKNVTATFSNQ